MDRDEVLAELSDVATQLSQLPRDAFEARVRLRQRQEELRAISRNLMQESGDPESAQQIRERLEQLESERDRYLSGRPGG